MFAPADDDANNDGIYYDDSFDGLGMVEDEKYVSHF